MGGSQNQLEKSFENLKFKQRSKTHWNKIHTNESSIVQKICYNQPHQNKKSTNLHGSNFVEQEKISKFMALSSLMRDPPK